MTFEELKNVFYLLQAGVKLIVVTETPIGSGLARVNEGIQSVCLYPTEGMPRTLTLNNGMLLNADLLPFSKVFTEQSADHTLKALQTLIGRV